MRKGVLITQDLRSSFFRFPLIAVTSEWGSVRGSGLHSAFAMQSSLILLLAAAHVVVGDTVMLPMRDGVKLSTDVDFPRAYSLPPSLLAIGLFTQITPCCPFLRFAAFFPAGRRAPAVFERSPYGHAAEELIALVFAELLGYVGIRQDMRGTGVSLARTAPCSCANKTRAPLRPTLNAPTRTLNTSCPRAALEFGTIL